MSNLEKMILFRYAVLDCPASAEFFSSQPRIFVNGIMFTDNNDYIQLKNGG